MPVRAALGSTSMSGLTHYHIQSKSLMFTNIIEDILYYIYNMTYTSFLDRKSV